MTGTQVTLNDLHPVAFGHELNIERFGIQRLGNDTGISLDVANSVAIELLSREKHDCISTVDTSVL